MAGYREFHFEKTYAAPRPGTGTSASNILDSVGDGVSAIFKAVREQKEKKAAEANKLEYTLQKGTDINDDNLINAEGTEAINMYKQGTFEGNKAKVDQAKSILSDVKQAHEFRQKGDQMLKVMNDQVEATGKEKPWYDTSIDKSILLDAYHGPGGNGEHNYLNRMPFMQEASKVVGKNPMALRTQDYTKHYVGNLAADQTAIQLKNGDTVTKKSIFGGDISDKNVMDFLSSEELLPERLGIEVTAELMEEAKQWKQRNPKETKGMSDAEAAKYLKDIPQDNPINKNGFTTRVKDKAKSLLKEAEGTLYNYNRKEGDTDTKPSYASSKEASSVINSNGGQSSYSIGVRLDTQDANKPVSINTLSGRTDINTGKVINKAKSSRDFKVTDVGLFPVVNGVYQPWTSGNIEEAKKYIDNIPLSAYDPKGNTRWPKNLSVGFVGYSMEDAKGERLREIQSKITDLHRQRGEAKKKNNQDEVSRIDYDISQANNLVDKLQNYNPGSGEAATINNMAVELGIQNLRVESILHPSEGDYVSLSRKEGGTGVDYRNKSNWTSAMRELDAYNEKKYNEAMTKLNQSKQPSQKATVKKTKAKFPLPSGQDEEVEQNGQQFKWNYETGKYEWKKK